MGEAHLLAVDWLGWICYLFDKLEVIILTLSQLRYNLHIDYISVYQRFPAKHLI